jgi:hypothetical protein
MWFFHFAMPLIPHVQEAKFTTSMSNKLSAYQIQYAHTSAMMSFQQLPPQANPSYQQRTIHPSHALASALFSSPQSTTSVRVQSVPALGQGAGHQSGICQHFAEVCTSTYKWMPIATAVVHELAALRIPVQVTRGAVASGIPLPTGDGPNQRYALKSSSPNPRYDRPLHVVF